MNDFSPRFAPKITHTRKIVAVPPLFEPLYLKTLPHFMIKKAASEEAALLKPYKTIANRTISGL